MSRLAEIISLIQHIPPFPKVAIRVLELLKDPDVEADQLAEIIQYDPSITANVLKMCNAAYFGLPRKVSSLDEALVVLGNATLKDIIIASSSAKFLRGQVGAGYKLEQGDMWKHSVAAGIMAKLLVRDIKGVDSGSAFTCGLLHDIGKRFMSSFVADDFEEIIRKVEKEQCSFVAAEKSYLGITHADLGGMILEKWEFPQEQIEAVKHHHDPDALEQDDLTALVALANGLVITLGIGVGADGLATELHGRGLERFGITPEGLQFAMADLFIEMEKAEDVINL